MVSQLPAQDELVWDNGSAYPEPCVDRIAPHIGKVRSNLLSLEFVSSFIVLEDLNAFDFETNGSV